jgi:hypothetical protein
MLISQVFFYKGSHAFNLYLNVEKQSDNTVLSTIPTSLLQKYFPSLMATILFAHIPNAFAGEKYLQMLSNRVFRCAELHVYFYPNYLQENGRVSVEVAEQIINLQDSIHMLPRCYYSEQTDKVKFFVLSHLFLRKKRHILRTAQFISKDRFEHDYLLSVEMMQEFKSHNEQNTYLELLEEGQIEYVLVLSPQEELKMFICL